MDYSLTKDEHRIHQLLTTALRSPSKHHPILTEPFFDNPMNLVGQVLAEQFHEHWIRHFDVASAGGPETDNVRANVTAHRLISANPLYRLPLTVYFEWTYGTHGSSKEDQTS